MVVAEKQNVSYSYFSSICLSYDPDGTTIQEGRCACVYTSL